MSRSNLKTTALAGVFGVLSLMGCASAPAVSGVAAQAVGTSAPDRPFLHEGDVTVGNEVVSHFANLAKSTDNCAQEAFVLTAGFVPAAGRETVTVAGSCMDSSMKEVFSYTCSASPADPKVRDAVVKLARQMPNLDSPPPALTVTDADVQSLCRFTPAYRVKNPLMPTR